MEIGIGLDIGGTHICAVALDRGAKTAKDSLSSSERAVTDRDVDTVVGLIVECLIEVHEKLAGAYGDEFEISGIGFGVPGNVDPTIGVTRYLPNFQWLDTVPLKDLVLKKLFGAESSFGHCDASRVRVEMRNDGRVAAIAEFMFGSGKDSDGISVFSMLTLGTGIGGAVIIDGKLFDGASFDAGDFGHHTIRSGEGALPCVCGKTGCFETHASAQGLVRLYNRLPGAEKCCTGPDGRGHDALGVLKKLRAGDAVAAQAFEIYADDLSTGLANLVTFYNPNVIVLGGGFGQAEELYVGDEIQHRVDAKSLPATRGKVKVVRAVLGSIAGALGAALLALGRGV